MFGSQESHYHVDLLRTIHKAKRDTTLVVYDSLSANQVLKQVAFIITIVYIDAIVALPSSIVMIMME